MSNIYKRLRVVDALTWHDFGITGTMPALDALILVNWPQEGAYQVGRARYNVVEWADFEGGELDYTILRNEGALWRYIIK